VFDHARSPAPRNAGNCLPGDFRAVEQQYSGLVFGTALRCVGCRQMAQEVAQDVFLLLVKKARHVLPENTGGWLHRTAVLKARERLRAEARYRRRVAAYARCHTESQPVVGTHSDTEQVLERLDEALNRLPERYRRIIFLRYFEGLDAREIAARLGITPETAQKQCERARSRLAEKLAIAGVLAGGVLRAQLSPGDVVAGASAWSRPRSSMPMSRVHGIFRLSIASLGAAACFVVGLLLLPDDGGRHSGRLSCHSQMPPEPLTPVGVPTSENRPVGSVPRDLSLKATTELDLASLAVLLERADEADAMAATEAETILAGQGITELRHAADLVPGLELPVNQLRLLALGLVRHLVTRDGRAAVLAGEQLWRAQHGASAPLLASLVNEALAQWALEDRVAASRWYEAAAAERLFEDRGLTRAEFEDRPDATFQRALEMERTACDLSARVALAQSLLQPKESGEEGIPSWQVMADVWAHKLTPADARELADLLWTRSDLPTQSIFQFRLALVTLPTIPPSLESVCWAATPHGQHDVDAALAGAVVDAWWQIHPAGTALWLATLGELPERTVILSSLPAAGTILHRTFCPLTP
jgi:RNA polymerase sigma factor (sigma-70 family)